jgi:hypothetical protein
MECLSEAEKKIKSIFLSMASFLGAVCLVGLFFSAKNQVSFLVYQS